MTKEELKQELIDVWHKTFNVFILTDEQAEKICKVMLEPREKRIAELEAQVEKMKNCHNCKHWHWKHERCEKKAKGDCFKQSKWELAE